MDTAEPLSTKALILSTALALFSEHGYAAVSMRDIASSVGIRASSIYHHFASKQALWDALIDNAEAMARQMMAAFNGALEKTQGVSEKAFVETGVYCVTGYLESPSVAPLLRVLESQRRDSERADAVWRQLVLTLPITHQQRVFTRLMERGELPAGDAEALASEYHAAILLGMLSGNLDRLRAMLKRFYERVFIKPTKA